MNIIQAFKLAGKSIISSKLRSFLTMLGMIIGVSSVIILVGLMQGVTNYILETFSDMGTNILTVSVTNTDTRNITPDEMYEFAEENNSIILAISPVVSSRYTAKNGENSLSTSVKGVGEDYMDMNTLSISMGRAIDYADIKNRYNGCVIGTYIVDELFDGSSALGKEIRINGEVYTVVGVQEEQADSEEGSSDDCIYIPYSCATRLAKSTDITSYTIATVKADYVDRAESLLDIYLYSQLKSEDLYSISSMTELLDTLNSITGTLSMILSGIAGISLLVAGIGIMNIMLVSVVERTKEIGIRKSLGAKRSDIASQFVIEAAVISTLGGILGILLGVIVTTVLGNVFGVNASPTVSSILLAFGVSVGIGVGFGYMPANKAAKLHPIDALRSE